MKDTVLIIGATGFIGTLVTELILEQTDFSVIVLVRGRDLFNAKQRLERIWWDLPNLACEIGRRIVVIRGDIILPKLGLSDSCFYELTGSVGYIIHLAADIKLTKSLDELCRTNVTGVKNSLEFAKEVHRLHGLNRFSYVSTAYVAGGRKGIVSEDDLTDQYGFSNHYELSKFKAESLVKTAGKDIPISIFRPGMVIGDSKSGVIKTFNTIYFPLRLYLRGKLRFLPVNPSMKVNLVPCDYVAEAIVKLTFDPKTSGLTFHLTLPATSLPTVREIIEFTREWAAEKLHINLPVPIFIPISLKFFRGLKSILPRKSAVYSLFSLAPYFEENRLYQRENLDRYMGVYKGNWIDFFGQNLTYAVDKGFMHHSERTVHEQVILRLNSKSRPIRYHDVIHGKIITKNSEEIKREIYKTVSSLKQMGIKPGDRIAMVGFNSSRYFVIDVAIGLCGGVSVPLYYSSPISELIEIANNSGATLLFVGVPKILEKLVFVHLNIPVVSFCHETLQNNLPVNFMDWENFWGLGKDYEVSLDAPIGFNDIATLRYTSGTTGHPKGASFNHGQLLWMGETLASLPPWKARTRKVFYLSFLPMNHVVEGILTSYGIYYAPAPVDVFYLENFHELQKVMPKIRPTIFFSVPRFYEKVWEKASQSFIGRQYLRREKGLVKQLLKTILRMVIRKVAGIDRCAQLIVGSAPVSVGLLKSFREIGIEIHNAYGLTEAPLITLNRYRANEIDTVGEPLPHTQICIADDGEVLVKGPQVMKEYFGEDRGSTIKDGWFHTGDIGILAENNHLVLSGRKKEMLINSYGKNISPVKIELMIRETTGINQVIICGENLPYCTALLWGCSVHDPVAVAVIEEGIRKVNEQLSHPEQIKKWALLTENLSIEGGELTPNLKMKRSVILSKYEAVVKTLYEKVDSVEGVIFGKTS